METIQTVMSILTIFTGIALLAYLDKRYALGLNDGLNAGSNWFGCSSANTEAKLADKEREIEGLKERVATLEKIVTDPAEQLKREIDNLR